jgi:hypothetical protein
LPAPQGRRPWPVPLLKSAARHKSDCASSLALRGGTGFQLRKFWNSPSSPAGACSLLPEISMSPVSVMIGLASSPFCQRLKALPSV